MLRTLGKWLRNYWTNKSSFEDEYVVRLCGWRYRTKLTFRHRASSIQDRHSATLQRTLFIYLINKYISLS